MHNPSNVGCFRDVQQPESDVVYNSLDLVRDADCAGYATHAHPGGQSGQPGLPDEGG